MSRVRIRSLAAAALAVAMIPALIPTKGLSVPPIPFAPARIKLTQVATASNPVGFATHTIVTGQSTNYIIEQNTGDVRRLNADGTLTTILDLTGMISTGGERGLLGLAFSPLGDRLYVDYTDTSGHTNVDEYRFAAGAVVPGTRRRVLFITQPFSNHNGGGIGFGPDGFMYIPTGDGGSGGDPQNHGQRLDSLLGKVLRIDPLSAVPYAIPPGNPFVGVPGVRPEIWAYGMRNPWRWSFDRVTGDLWIGDVGQNLWEEIDLQPRSSPGGENYGWRCFEGTHVYTTCNPPIPNHTPPIYEYPHAGGACSVTGGYMYRGTKIPGLYGTYVFADFCAGILKGLRRWGSQSIVTDLGATANLPASFGQDAAGELYVLSHSGPIYRIDPLI